MENEEKKELDLTLVDIANEGMSKELYDSIVKNSIQDEQGSKRQACHGEKYVSKGLAIDLVKKGAVICAIAITFILASKGISAAATVDEYYAMLNEKAQTEFSISGKEVAETVGVTPIDIIKEHSEAFESLDSSEYDIYGNRINNDREYDRDIKNELYYHTDKQLDAQDIITDNTMDKYREMNK